MGGHSPWDVRGLNHSLSVPVLGSYMEETSPLGCLEKLWGRQRGWRSLDYTRVECLDAACHQTGAQRSSPAAATSLCSQIQAK